MRRPLLVVFVVSCSACPQLASTELRPGAQVLDAWPGNPRLPSGVSVQDVGFYGTELMVAHSRTSAGEIVNHPDRTCPECPGSGYATEGNSELFISRSDDDGVTWKTATVTAPWKYIDGLFSSSQRLYAIGSASSVGAGGGLYGYYEVRRLDPDDYTVMADPDVDGPKLVSMLRSMGSGRFAGLGVVPDQRTNVTATTWNVDYNVYDPSQLHLSQWHFTVPVQGCGPSSFELSGGSYVGYCRAPPKVCSVRITTAGVATTRCTDEAYWPEVLRAPNARNVLSPAGIWVPYASSASDPAASLAYLADGEGAPRTWELPGPVSLAPDSMHQAYAGLHKLFDGRFVRLQANGAYQVLTFLPSPCVDSAGCGPSRIAWLSPLPDGRYLVFYALEQPDNLRLVVLAQAPSVEAVGDGGTVRAGPPGHPEAQPAGPLDRFCQLASSCFGIAPSRCLGILDRGTVVNPPSLAGYVSAANCDDVLALWPALSVMGTPCDLPESPAGFADGCLGDVYVVCHDGLVISADEPCDGANQRCAPTRPCAVPRGPETCGATEPRCEGNTMVYHCEFESRFDCTFLGLSCVSDPFNGQGSCQAASPTSEVCSGFGRQCEGPFALFCRADSLRSIDCRDVGKSTCVVDGGDAWCQ